MEGRDPLWRRLTGFDSQTPEERRAARNAVSLFFGALIGANLGSFSDLALRDYTLLIAIVSLLVLYLHLAPFARRRWEAILGLGVTLALLYALLMTPFGAPMWKDGTNPSPHLFVTLAFWIVSVAWVELRPVRRMPRQEPEPGGDR